MFDMHATQEEDKLVLLRALDGLGACTQEQLLRFMLETGLQNQFQCLLALGGLKEAGLVRESTRPEGVLLVLTPQGRESMELFASRIRASLEQILTESCPAWRRRIRDEQQMPASWRETENGYVVTLRALEGGAELFSMNITAATRAQAKRFCERWPQRATVIYQTAMEQLGETQEDGEPQEEGEA